MDVSKWLDILQQAAQSKNWWLLVSLLLLAMTAAVRALAAKGKLGKTVDDWLDGNLGTHVLVFMLSFLGAVVSSLGGGTAMGLVVVFAAIKVALGAIGLWEIGSGVRELGKKDAEVKK